MVRGVLGLLACGFVVWRFRSGLLVIVNSVVDGAIRIHCLLVFVGMFKVVLAALFCFGFLLMLLGCLGLC